MNSGSNQKQAVCLICFLKESGKQSTCQHYHYQVENTNPRNRKSSSISFSPDQRYVVPTEPFAKGNNGEVIKPLPDSKNQPPIITKKLMADDSSDTVFVAGLYKETLFALEAYPKEYHSLVHCYIFLTASEAKELKETFTKNTYNIPEKAAALKDFLDNISARRMNLMINLGNQIEAQQMALDNIDDTSSTEYQLQKTGLEETKQYLSELREQQNGSGEICTTRSADHQIVKGHGARLVAPFFNGQTLQKYLDNFLNSNNTEQNWEVKALKALIATTAALKAFHQKGFVHGDINLGNILIDDSIIDDSGLPLVHLIDFGWSGVIGVSELQIAPLRDHYFTSDRFIKREKESAVEPRYINAASQDVGSLLWWLCNTTCELGKVCDIISERLLLIDDDKFQFDLLGELEKIKESSEPNDKTMAKVGTLLKQALPLLVEALTRTKESNKVYDDFLNTLKSNSEASQELKKSPSSLPPLESASSLAMEPVPLKASEISDDSLATGGQEHSMSATSNYAASMNGSPAVNPSCSSSPVSLDDLKPAKATIILTPEQTEGLKKLEALQKEYEQPDCFAIFKRKSKHHNTKKRVTDIYCRALQGDKVQANLSKDEFIAATEDFSWKTLGKSRLVQLTHSLFKIELVDQTNGIYEISLKNNSRNSKR